MTDNVDEQHPRRRIGCKTIIAIVLVVLLLGTWGGCLMQARSAMNAEIELVRARGMPVTIDDMDRYYPDFATRHAGAAYLAAYDLLQGDREELAAMPFFSNEHTPLRGEPWPEEKLDAARLLLERNTDALHQIETAAAMGPAWFSRNFTMFDEAYDEELARLRLATRLMCLRGQWLSQSRQHEAAIESVVVQWQMTEALRDEPMIMSHLVRIAMIDMACEASERLNDSQELSVANLRRLMIAARTTDDGNRGIVRALAGERASMFSAARYGDPTADLRLFTHPLMRMSSLADRNCTALLQLHGESIARVEGASTNTAPMSDLVEDMSVIYAPAKILMPTYDAVLAYDLRRRTLVDVTVVGMAVQLYFRTHEVLPDTLDDLVPEVIPLVPTDRFGEGTLKYRRTETGAIVYSVGADGIDDGGRELSDSGKRHGLEGADITFTIGDAQRELWPEQWVGDGSGSGKVIADD